MDELKKISKLPMTSGRWAAAAATGVHDRSNSAGGQCAFGTSYATEVFLCNLIQSCATSEIIFLVVNYNC